MVASTVTANALGTEPLSRDRQPSNDLPALIEAHKAAYAAFGKAVHERGSRSRQHIEAAREEEMALLAICAYPAFREGDCLTKAHYLLEIEAHGELDLAEHI
ncbi:hypothetical protein [Mesorhizobium sp. B3-1-6]|uniref:hypothetical protein n=1 Tax=Mesorhizobium sp. B3-1-6 TaxID=2589895 RepID=UPI001FEEC1EA|nr:hypothetical protein [Mesorhizobium sp. B3-1-6]